MDISKDSRIKLTGPRGSIFTIPKGGLPDKDATLTVTVTMSDINKDSYRLSQSAREIIFVKSSSISAINVLKNIEDDIKSALMLQG